MIDILRSNAIKKANEISIIDLNKKPVNEKTWKELYDYASAIAEFLTKYTDNNVAIASDNCFEWLAVFFGIIMCGKTAVLLNPFKSIEDIEYELYVSNCKIVFDGVNIQDKCIKHNENTKLVFIPINNVNQLFFSQNNHDDFELCGYKVGDIGCIYFSSGTTGSSKAVALSLNSLIKVGETELRHHRQTSDDVFLCAAPLYHVGAFAHWLGSLLSGSKAVLYRIETPHKTLYTIEKYKVTIAWLLLPWVQDILAAIDVGDIKLNDYNLGLWRLMHMGAQPIPEAAVKRWRDLFPNQQFDINYGLTESGGPGCIHLGLETTYKPQMLGVIDEEWEIGINNSGKVSKITNSIGEICVKGPSVMECYYNDLQATRQVLSDDGWLFTGDIGYIDEEGYVFYTGRKKDLIIVGGENIYPLEIENHIKKISKVKDVAVIGIPNNRLGEVVVAIVELSGENTEEIMRKEIRQHCRSLPVYKQPVKFFFDTIPRNSTGKIDKKQLYSKYASYRSDKIYE